MRKEQIKRTIHFYRLEFIKNTSNTEINGNHFQTLLNHIKNRVETKKANRYLSVNGRTIMVTDLKIHPGSKVVEGKLISIRSDIFPEIFKKFADTSRPIEAAEDEGIVEVTHFVIDYKKSKPLLLFEYNHTGGRIMDFIHYLNTMGHDSQTISHVEFISVAGEGLTSYKRRMNRCSELEIRIAKDRIEEVKEINEGLFSAFMATSNLCETDTVTIFLKIDYRNKKSTPQANQFSGEVISEIIKHPEKSDIFEKFIVKAEDEDKGNRLEAFDLLIMKKKADILVEKKERSRTIVSSDIFEKLRKLLV